MQISVFRQHLRLAATLLLVTAGLPATAQEPPVSRATLTAASPALSKVSGGLLDAMVEHMQPESARPGQGPQAAEAAASAGFTAKSLVAVEAGRAQVEIRVKNLSPALLEHLKQAGVEVSTASLEWGRVNGTVGLDALAAVAAVQDVTTIHPNYGYVTHATNQADISMNSDDSDGARSLGVDGSGVTIGILSDSFNNTLGGTESGGTCDCSTPMSTCSNVVMGMANQPMDLPASVTLLDDGPGGPLTDEGAAIGELIFDIAPGADLAFHSAANSLTDFADGITRLANCGADIIVDDVGYFAEPMFQDGVIAQAAQAAVDAGIPYFSAAGNGGTFGVIDEFTDSVAMDDMYDPVTMGGTPTGADFHDFDATGGTDPYAAITFPGGCSVTAVLQWSEPFSGSLGPGASSDLDLYFCLTDGVATSCGLDPDGGGPSPPLRSATRQGCGTGAPPAGDPLEILAITNGGGTPLTGFFAVEHFCGSEDVEFRIATFASCAIPGAYDFEDGQDGGTPDPGETPIFTDAQIYGHPAAAGVVAVAAIDYREVDSGGTFQAPMGELNVEPFSSLGGDLPFYFTGGGTPLGPVGSPPGPLAPPPAPTTRAKPDIAAPDGVDTTFFGTDTSDAGGDPNFFGTSAAAPNAAAVAALMMELGNLSPSGLTQVIQQGAIDWETGGFDFLSGFGEIEALNSVGTTLPSGAGCFIDDLELFGKPNTGTQSFRACTSITYGSGDFSDVDGDSPLNIFADGFESGDTSSWTN